MLATFSPESIIKNRLYLELNCAESVFAAISGIVSRSRLAQALSGQKPLGETEARLLLGVMDEMKKMQDEMPLPIDWTRVSKIQESLAHKRIQQIVRELEG